MGEPESELASLPEKNAERRGQLDLHHRLHAPPQDGGNHAVAQQGQDPGQVLQADAVHLQPGRQLPEGLRTLAVGHVGRRGRVTGEG